MATQTETQFNVGGVLLDRPFKALRLGHFGFDVDDVQACLPFYTELLGFRVSDIIDFARRPEDKERFTGIDTRGYFTRHGGDHHAFALFPRAVARARGMTETPEVTINQITWQTGSLAEIHNAVEWLAEKGIRINRSGRESYGAHCSAYFYDLDGHLNELYWGIEQIGWTGISKPEGMKDVYRRNFSKLPDLPLECEASDVNAAIANGLDLLSGYRYVEPRPATYDVDGVLLPRPFKITRIGPVSLFVSDVEASLAFYRDVMGLTLTEEVVWKGHRCAFLRANTEHHSIALYPLALRGVLGLSPHTTCMAFGLQLANYRQLCDAIAFLRENGCRVTTNQIPPDLQPGTDYVAHVFDPEGHCLQLYYYMEQVGWDGRPRPAELRRAVDPANWPERLEHLTDTYGGEPFFGPWG